MADAVSVHVPIVKVRLSDRDSDGFAPGYITTPWLRYLLASSPDGYGTGTGVLHGNPSGAPTWAPVDLAADVTGTLPVANGGLGGIAATLGGLLYFATATQVASSAALTAHQLVLGGGTGAPTSLAAGASASLVLHANPSGAPTWGLVNVTTEVSGVLLVSHGGTGTTSATGTGLAVLNNGPTLVSPFLSVPTMNAPTINDVITQFGPITTAQLNSKDSNETFVTGVATTVIAADKPMLFIAHDKTNGDMSVGVISSVGVNVFVAGIGGIAWTRLAGTGLQAQVTAGINPRDISVYAISIGNL